GGDLLKTFSLPGTESQRTFDVLKKDFARGGDTGYLVFKSNAPKGIRSPAVVDEIQNKLVPTLREQKHVASVVTPYDQGGAGFVSSKGNIAYAEIQFDVQANDVPIVLASHIRDLVKQANSPGLQVELGGAMFTHQTQPAREASGILAAVINFLLAFRPVRALGLPIMTGLCRLGTGLAIGSLLARVSDV